MRGIQRHIIISFFILMAFAFAMKSAYKYLAETGKLNEEATKKFEDQTKNTGTSLVGLLMGGRVTVFASAYACFQNPIWGYGPWAVDTEGIYSSFLAKYGNGDDYEEYELNLQERLRKGNAYPLIPGHSHIFGFWVSYGIFALPLWLYVIYLVYNHLSKNIAVIPQYFGLFALGISSFLWHVMFSPFTSRMSTSLLIVLMLFADAIRRGRLELPIKMQLEIWEKC